MNPLEDARKQINEVDKEMARLFEKRMQAVEDVIQYKMEHDLPILDSSREHYVIEYNMQFIQQVKYKESYKLFIQEVMEISRKYQKSVIFKDQVGYQGVQGAFSYIASEKLFPNEPKKSYATFEAICKAVENGELAYGVIPFENSYTGEIGEVLDLLMEYNVYVKRMYDLGIRQNLLGVQGATLHDVKQVYSKDQAIYQSQNFLEGRNYEVISYPNTALAAEYVAKENDKTKAAIGAKENAKLYGLSVLARDINTSKQNTTRFIVISKDKQLRGNEFNVAFTLNHEVGALSKAMQVIAMHGFNMQNIRSRTIQNCPWEYYFYIEIAGDVNGVKEQKMLSELGKVCARVKVLGAYEKESRDEKCAL